MAESKEARFARVHGEALDQYDDIQYALQAERRMCIDDRRFYSIAGAQWEGPWLAQFENKPRIEVNKVHLSVMRIVGEYRANRITVDFVSKDGADDRLADVCDGLYRADEQDSVADEAYDNAFEEAVGGGFGAWRLRADWEDELDPENDKQRIRIEPIFDADTSVFFDLEAKRQDKSDARFAFVVTSMTSKAYEERYNDDPSTWPKLVTRAQYDWCTPDVVYVAEYYRVEEKVEVQRVFRLLDGSEQVYTREDFDADENLERMLESTGAVELPQRRRKQKRVHKYVLSGGRILEDQGYIPGKCIPIVPVYGKRWFVDNVERCMGVVRLAKDAQRLANMQKSKLTEIAALSPIEKPIFLPEQVSGEISELWRTDNIVNRPYLVVNPITNADGSTQPAGPVGYTKPPQVSPALAAVIQMSEQDIRDTLGNPEGADKLVSGVSGKAIEAVTNRIDQNAYIYMSNFAKAMKRCGEIWLSMAREVYVEEGRRMKSVGPDGGVSTVELQKPTVNEAGAFTLDNDLSRASFDVVSEVGPSTQSRRDAEQRSYMSLLQITKDPQTAGIIEQLMLMNMDGEGMADVREFARKKLLAIGVVKPTQEEAQAMAAAAQQQQPDPQALYLQAAAQEAQARAMKAQADTQLAIAKSEETKAKTVETLANVNISAQSQAIKTAEAIARATTARPQTQASGQPMPE
jgi:hypothetical protein